MPATWDLKERTEIPDNTDAAPARHCDRRQLPRDYSLFSRPIVPPCVKNPSRVIHGWAGSVTILFTLPSWSITY